MLIKLLLNPDQLIHFEKIEKNQGLQGLNFRNGQGFHRRLTSGGFLRIGYCSRTTGYCFPFCFLEIFVGDKALIEGDKVVIGGIPQSLY